MVSAIFTELQTIATSFISFLVNVFNGVISLVYTTGDNPGLTVLGTLLLIGLATGLVMWAFYFIRSLIRVRRG